MRGAGLLAAPRASLVIVSTPDDFEEPTEAPDPTRDPPQAVRRGGALPLPADRSELTIGRIDICDIPLPHGAISRIHARIQQEGDCHVIVDARSTNGVNVNGKKIERAVLKDGDEIKIGLYLFKYVVSPADEGGDEDGAAS